MPKKYIGITDFRTKEQSLEMLQVLRTANMPLIHKYRLAIGVMMSWKTLHGHETKWSKTFPKNTEIADIFLAEPDVYNVLHYADYDGHPVLENLLFAAALGGPNLNALQLDMIWPEPKDVIAFRRRHPKIGIIIQANTKALDLVGNSPSAFVEKLREYDGSIDYVLLDKSMGRGLGMDAKSLLPFALAIEANLKQKTFNIAIAAAGGLGPDTVHLVGPLAYELPGISIDAQSKLRPSGSALDPIDWSMAKLYIERAVKFLDDNAFDRR